MRRRLDLAAGLVGGPAVIFLDEPTTGLDPRSRQAMWQVVTIWPRGVTVFLTTQYLEEADRLADRIALLDGGRVVADGTPAELKPQVAGQRLDLVLADAAAFDEVAGAWTTGSSTATPAASPSGVATDGSAAQVRALLDEVDPARQDVERFAVHRRHPRRRVPGPDRPADRPDRERPQGARRCLSSPPAANPAAASPQGLFALADSTMTGRCLRLTRRNVDARSPR